MEFNKDVEVPDHSHKAQWGVVLAGKIDLTIDGFERTYTKGDSVFIPKGVKHSAKVHAGYADVSFFNQKERYKPKKTSDKAKVEVQIIEMNVRRIKGEDAQHAG